MKTVWITDDAHSKIKLAAAMWDVKMKDISSQMCYNLGKMIFAENGKEVFFGESKDENIAAANIDK